MTINISSMPTSGGMVLQFSLPTADGVILWLRAAWNIAKEDFLKGNNTINSLKLKVSYGQQGNDNILLENSDRDYYAYQDIYGINNFGEGKPVLSLRKQGNKDLKWETSKNLNAGFEISLLKNRISLNADYFERKVSDMIYTLPLPPSNAGSYIKYGNIGDMINRGVQANLNIDILRSDELQWSFYANATHYKNKITKLPAEQRSTGLVSGLFILTEGGDRYTYYLKKFAGTDPNNGDALWYRTNINPNTKRKKLLLPIIIRRQLIIIQASRPFQKYTVVSVPISLIKDSIWQLILLISLVVMAMTTSTEVYSIPILMLPTTQQIWIKHGHRKTRMLHYHV